jgi:hypothetical protein
MGSYRVSQQLRLVEFRKFYLVMRRGLPEWASFLLLGFLVWVEERTIKTRINNTIEDAIEEYEKQNPSRVVVPPPVYSETGTDFFDEMRLTAPWKVQDTPSDPP